MSAALARFPELIRRFAVPIIVGWVLLAGALNVLVPQLEQVVAENSPPFVPSDLRSSTALTDMARTFEEGTSNNVVYVALLGDDELGADARDYYRDLVSDLRAEPLVDTVRDLWSDPVSAAASESADGRMVYTQLWLQGDMGETRSFEAIDRVEQIVGATSPPAGVRAFVTGPPAVLADEFVTGARDAFVVSVIGSVIILTVLLAVYRSLITALLPLVSVGLGLLVARPVVALLGEHQVIQVSLFALAMSAALMLGAGVDYAIFFLGRYHEAIRNGQSRHQAYDTAYRRVNHVIVASGLTIAGACACLVFTQISVLNTAGIPCALSILIGLAAALTLTPALVTVAGRRGYLDPVVGTERERRWRRIGTAVVRWPVPTFIAATAVLAVLTSTLPSLVLSFNEIAVQPADTPSVQAMAELEEHFPNNQASPDFVTIHADHDMRNPSDTVAIEEVSRALAKRPDVDSVLSISRPTGHLLAESLLVNQAGVMGARLEQDTALLGERVTDLNTVDANLTAMAGALDTLEHDFDRVGDQIAATGSDVNRTVDGVDAIRRSADEVIAAVDPLRRQVADHPDCGADLLCSAAQTAVTAFDSSPLPAALEGVGTAAAGADRVADGTDRTVAVLRSALGDVGAMREQITGLQTVLHRTTGTLEMLTPELAAATDYLQEIGRNYGTDESGIFYLPQQVFDDPRFAVAIEAMFSPDGKMTRLLVYGNTSAFGQTGIDRARGLEQTARDVIAGGRLDGAVVQVGGIGATFADVQQIMARDFKVLVIVTMLLVFSVVLVVLRSLVAALTVVTTVALSYASAVGVSVLVWQHLLGIELHWAVPALAFIALVAVGSDYNLLFTARMRDEASGGLHTGIIRAFGGTGSVVTIAGVVFASTMFAMLGSTMTNIMQLGSTVGMGLLVDTFIVRAVIVPAIASRLGIWFWWPLPRRKVLAPVATPAVP
ncbi:RND family transporter [Mycolicibacillus trivialis]